MRHAHGHVRAHHKTEKGGGTGKGYRGSSGGGVGGRTRKGSRPFRDIYGRWVGRWIDLGDITLVISLNLGTDTSRRRTRQTNMLQLAHKPLGAPGVLTRHLRI